MWFPRPEIDRPIYSRQLIESMIRPHLTAVSKV